MYTKAGSITNVQMLLQTNIYTVTFKKTIKMSHSECNDLMRVTLIPPEMPSHLKNLVCHSRISIGDVKPKIVVGTFLGSEKLMMGAGLFDFKILSLTTSLYIS